MNFEDIMKLNTGYQLSRILYTAVDLGIFESIGEETLNSSDISGKCKTDLNSTEIFLNSLVSLKLLKKTDHLYSNTADSQKYLLNASNQYVGDIITFTGTAWNKWSHLSDTIKEGKPFDIVYEEKQYEPEWGKFIRGMHNFAISRGDAKICVDILDLSNKSKLLDIACGPGTYSYELAKEYSVLNITLFDLPETIKVAKNIFNEYELHNKVDFVVGNYKLDELPKGFDCGLLFNIIHQEKPDENILLIKKIYDSLNADGIIVIKDHVLNEDKTLPENGAIFSVYMQLLTGGMCYSEKEIYSWLADIGFKEITMIEPIAPMTSAFVTGIKKN